MKVFIDIGPMHFIAVWPEFIVAALFGRGVQQARIPGKRDAYCSAIAQPRMQVLVVELDSCDSLVCFAGQNSQVNLSNYGTRTTLQPVTSCEQP